MVDHRIDAEEAALHRDWDSDRSPVLTVDPGETVAFDCLDANGGDIGPDTTPADLHERGSDGHPLTGPVAVRGAEPGDTLAVDIRDVDTADWGYTLYRPGEWDLGLLPDEFPDPGLHYWDLDDGVGHFVSGIEVPLAPFPGIVGVAPGSPGPHSTMPPRNVGGNLDIKHLTAGSTLYLPVEVSGALLSVGDAHAAQGDGEVCVSAIETPAEVTVRVRLAGRDVERPQFETDGPFTPSGSDEPMLATSGVDDDLFDASRLAVRDLIDRLHDDRGLSRGEAYILCSVAADLKINEVVDAPNWVVSAYLPEGLFPGGA
jgi:acetamidase/formamidase